MTRCGASWAASRARTPDTGPDGETQWLYLANAYTQGVKPGYEDDPVLYTKSVYYSPKEI